MAGSSLRGWLMVEVSANAVKEGTTSQGTMQQQVAGNPEGAVESLVSQSSPDLGESRAQGPEGGLGLRVRGSFTWSGAGWPDSLKVHPGKLRKVRWVRGVNRLLHRRMSVDGPLLFQVLKPTQSVRVVVGIKGPDLGPSSLLLLVPCNSLARGHVVHVVMKESLSGLANLQGEKVDLHIVDTDTPHSRVQLHVFPRAHHPRLQDAFPVTGWELLLGTMLNDVISQPGILGLGQEVNEDRLGGASRRRGINWERMKAATWPQLPEAGNVGHGVRPLKDGPAAEISSCCEHTPVTLREVYEVNHLTPLGGKPRQDEVQVSGSCLWEVLPMQDGLSHVPEAYPSNGFC